MRSCSDLSFCTITSEGGFHLSPTQLSSVRDLELKIGA